MKRIALGLTLALFLSLNAYAQNGSGELKLSNAVIDNFYEYISKKRGEGWHYVVSVDGIYSNYTFCPTGSNCSETVGSPMLGVKGTILKCERRSNKKCYVLARKQKIVWNNLNVKIKSKISLDDFKNILANHNLTYFAGVSNNNQIVSPRPSNNNQIVSPVLNMNMIEQLEALNKMHKNGVITDDEFKKAKKKLLN